MIEHKPQDENPIISLLIEDITYVLHSAFMALADINSKHFGAGLVEVEGLWIPAC